MIIKKVLICIAEVYEVSSRIKALSEEENIYNEIEEQFEPNEIGKVTLLKHLLDSLKEQRTVLNT